MILYMNQNGRIVCGTRHGGLYLRTAVKADAINPFIETPSDTWTQLDAPAGLYKCDECALAVAPPFPTKLAYVEHAEGPGGVTVQQVCMTVDDDPMRAAMRYARRAIIWCQLKGGPPVNDDPDDVSVFDVLTVDDNGDAVEVASVITHDRYLMPDLANPVTR